MQHYIRVEGGHAHWKLLATCSHWGGRRQQIPMKVVGLLGPRLQIRRYTPVYVLYQCPNDDTHFGEDSGGCRLPFC